MDEPDSVELLARTINAGQKQGRRLRCVHLHPQDFDALARAVDPPPFGATTAHVHGVPVHVKREAVPGAPELTWFST